MTAYQISYQNLRDFVRRELRTDAASVGLSRRTARDLKSHFRLSDQDVKDASREQHIKTVFQLQHDRRHVTRRAAHLLLCMIRGRTYEQCERATGPDFRFMLYDLVRLAHNTVTQAFRAVSGHEAALDRDGYKVIMTTTAGVDVDLSQTGSPYSSATPLKSVFHDWVTSRTKTLSELVGAPLHAKASKEEVEIDHVVESADSTEAA
jgi:hypothetical protein